MPATIELRTRDIKFTPYIPLLGTPQHGYFIHTLEDGQNKHIVRAGPTNDQMLAGDLHVDYAAYNSNIQGAARNDYITDPSLYRTTILYSGDDATSRKYMDKIWEYGKHLNNNDFDYKLPLCDVISFGAYNKCSQQNSNAFIQKAIDYAGLPMRFPTYADGNPVWMPGLKSEIRDTLADHMIEYAGRYADLTATQAQSIYQEYSGKRAGIAGKFQTAYKMAEAAYLVAHNTPQLIAMSKEFEKWQKEQLDAMNKEQEALRESLQAKANSDCVAKGHAIEASGGCGPSTPGVHEVRKEVVVTYTPNMGCAFTKQLCMPDTHTTTTHYMECPINLVDACREIKSTYQDQLETAKGIMQLKYETAKTLKMQANAKSITGSMDHSRAEDHVTKTYANLKTEMMGELNAVKNSLCDQYHIQHDYFG